MNIKIQRHLKSTIVSQIVDQIHANVQLGTLQEGAQLPSIREFSKKYDVSHVTVSKAYKRLEKSGLIELVHGKGAFVKSNPSTTTLSTRLSHSLDDQWLSSLKRYSDSTPYPYINSKDRRFNLSEAIINPKLLPSDYLVKKVNQIL
mgnify:CR=1 FL=1